MVSYRELRVKAAFGHVSSRGTRKRIDKFDPEKGLFPRPNTRKIKSELDGAKLFGYVFVNCVDFAISYCKSVISSLLPMKCMFREGMQT